MPLHTGQIQGLMTAFYTVTTPDVSGIVQYVTIDLINFGHKCLLASGILNQTLFKHWRNTIGCKSGNFDRGGWGVCQTLPLCEHAVNSHSYSDSSLARD